MKKTKPIPVNDASARNKEFNKDTDMDILLETYDLNKVKCKATKVTDADIATTFGIHLSNLKRYVRYRNEAKKPMGRPPKVSAFQVEYLKKENEGQVNGMTIPVMQKHLYDAAKHELEQKGMNPDSVQASDFSNPSKYLVAKTKSSAQLLQRAAHVQTAERTVTNANLFSHIAFGGTTIDLMASLCLITNLFKISDVIINF